MILFLERERYHLRGSLVVQRFRRFRRHLARKSAQLLKAVCDILPDTTSNPKAMAAFGLFLCTWLPLRSLGNKPDHGAFGINGTARCYFLLLRQCGAVHRETHIPDWTCRVHGKTRHSAGDFPPPRREFSVYVVGSFRHMHENVPFS